MIVSAHLGNWELMLGLAHIFEDIMPVMFLVEASFHPALNRFLADVRGTGGGESNTGGRFDPGATSPGQWTTMGFLIPPSNGSDLYPRMRKSV